MILSFNGPEFVKDYSLIMFLIRGNLSEINSRRYDSIDEEPEFLKILEKVQLFMGSNGIRDFSFGPIETRKL